MISVTILGGRRLEDLSAASLDRQIESRVRFWGEELKRAVVRHASGRPGPQIITGEYVASIQVEHQGSGLHASARVYSDEPYSARLEYGYSGTDADGRFQFSPPFPHFRPALEEIEPQFLHDMSSVRIR